MRRHEARSQHCGACGHACSTGQICVAGTCRSNDATLSSLTFSSGTLSPAFSPATTAYVLEASSLRDLRVTATPTSPDATLTLDGAPLAPGESSKAAGLNGIRSDNSMPASGAVYVY